MKGGIPEKFYEDVYEFRYNNLDQLEDLMKKYGDQTAAIIMTPFGHPLHQKMEIPKPGFLEGVRELATRYGAVLVFDEVRTCFRLRMGGAQELYGVTPDLTALGKGMANGYAISVVTGKADVMMAAAQKLFISSTFFPNSDGYIAALKTIEIMERDNVLNNIWEKGNRLLTKIQNIIDKYEVGAELSGVAPMFLITFKKDEASTQKGKRDDFYTQLIRKGFFFTPHHHAYISYRHTEEDLDKTATAIDEAMAYVKEKYQK
jgi:glutamate-1-semialdehyde aminotransferase